MDLNAIRIAERDDYDQAIEKLRKVSASAKDLGIESISRRATKKIEEYMELNS